MEANRQQPVGGSRKPAGESQQVEDGCQQATASRRERTDKLTRESRKPAGASQQVEGGCQQATASQQARERTDKLDRCGSQQATASRREKEASRWKLTVCPIHNGSLMSLTVYDLYDRIQYDCLVVT